MGALSGARKAEPQIAAHRMNCWHQTTPQGGHSSDAHREEKGCGVQCDVHFGRNHTRRNYRRHGFQSPKGKNVAGDAACRSQDETLDQQLPHKPAAASAQ